MICRMTWTPEEPLEAARTARPLDARPEPSSRTGRRRQARARRRKRRLKIIAISTAAVLVAGVGASYAIIRKLEGNITTLDAFGQLDEDRPVETGSGDPIDILVMGSDTRSGDNAALGGKAEGARSDTTIAMHIAGDRKSATAVSIPRDTMVDIPACPLDNGKESRAGFGQFNSAFTTGGPTCTIKTVESITGITFEHFVVVDFTGFVGMVDAVGGVDICLAEPLKDRQANVNLPDGQQTVNGQQALGVVRSRHNSLGDGGDLDRIDHQQQFLGAMIRKVLSSGTLLNPARLLGFLNEATKSVTMDPDLASVTGLADLASSLKDVAGGQIKFVTAPTGAWSKDPNRLVLKEGEADAVWAALRDDKPLPGTPEAAAAAAAAAAAPAAAAPAAPPVTVAPSKVRVQVLNGTGQKGLAAEVADQLEAQGFVVVGTGNADKATQTYALHGSDKADSVRTVAAAAGNVRTELDSALGNTITLVLGDDFESVVPVTVQSGSGSTTSATPAPTPTLTPKSADDTACIGAGD